MKILKIDREKLVKALMDLTNAAGDNDLYPWLVTFNPTHDSPIEARVIWADTPSSMGGYFANFVGEENVMLQAFLEPGNDYRWSDAPEDDDEEGDLGLERMAAEDWIVENLVPVADLGDLGLYQVEYV